MSKSTFFYLASQHLPLNQAHLLNCQHLDRGSQRAEEEEIWAGNAQKAATREQSLTASPNSAAAKGRVSASWRPLSAPSALGQLQPPLGQG